MKMNPSGSSLNENVSISEDVIKAINKDAVHRICSGQVVLNLATAVKELVENALDAGATIIDVRLKEYGQEVVEVNDNGCGVAEPNFSGLALKYHTSKLREFSDLLGISTFGFRGEALSSLCALSELNITTRHISADCGTKIVYNSKGIIEKLTPCARQIGTTVSLSKLFYTLPVRQKEFHRNIKREFNKMTQILYAYCLVSEGVKITCSNQTIKGTKSVIVSTQGGKINDNIACVFGSKQLQSLLKLTPIIPDISLKNIKEKFFSDLENAKTQPSTSDETIDIDDIKPDDLELSEESSNDADYDNTSALRENGTNDVVKSPSTNKNKPINKMKNIPVDFDGFISSCEHNSGRSTTDRQFFYINSRPCEPQKISKVINETYKQFNSNQYPFVYLNLKVKQSSVDVNVTPDKRKIFLERENFILDVIKSSLLNVFENIPSTLRFENVKISTQKLENIENNATNNPRIFSSFLSQFTNKGCKKEKNESVSVNSENKRKAETLDDYLECKIIRTKSPEILNESTLPEDTESENDVKPENMQVIYQEADNNSDNIISEETHKIEHIQQTDSGVEIFDEPKEAIFLGYTDHIPLSQIVSVNDVLVDSKESKAMNASIKKKSPKTSDKKVMKTVKNDVSSDTLTNRNSCTIEISVEEIKRYLQDDLNRQSNAKNVKKVKFRTEINPVLNKKCEEELQKELSKDMFSQMKIIGQFNLGFIITKLQDDLFIIDQHASDEKYNFETLQKTTVLSNQKLVVHKNLELTGSNERLLMDNLEIFHKNGFTFEIDPEAPPTKRVKLLTVPISKNCIFGKNDIEEILFMLKDGSSNDVYRPSRIQSMFASRACRKSVMIGTALNNSVMRKLVDHMGIIDHPWNCPHGRPTIRHLINLALSESRS